MLGKATESNAISSICCVASVNVFVHGLTSNNDSAASSSPSSAENNSLKATSQREAAIPTRKPIKSAKNTHILNKKLLNKLGLAKVRAPNSHNRKRLAVESRRHASPDDSHMFIIKLPPNLYYYTGPKASMGASSKNNALDHSNGKKVSFNFNSNGKPSRVYHWNLPVLKKILSDKSRFPSTIRSKDELLDIKSTPTWTKPWENETIEKSYAKSNMAEKKSLKKKSPTYYAPSNAVNKNSFNKYFSGNGKPKGFYLLKENHKKSSYYKNITP